MNIVHISDLHFGMNFPHMIEAFQQDIESIQPTIVIISGDLTQRAKVYQFVALQKFLKQFSCPVLLVPGNHDIPLGNPLTRLFIPYHQYQNHVGKSYPSVFENSSLRILGVNSVDRFHFKNGKLSFFTLQTIKNFFSNENEALNILFFHHNFDNIHSLHHPLKNDKEFLEYLKESTIHLVCTGHLHHAHIALVEKNNGFSTLVLHAGSLCCTRSKDGLNSYYLIKKQQGLTCEIEWRVFNDRQFEIQAMSQIDFSAKHAKLTGIPFANTKS